jgi:energy-coupling factor transporter ATP-binding protein EcfA2
VSPQDLPPADNPFSSRRVRPGAIAYRFPPGQTAEGIVGRLEQNGWRGQIVGPHGTGKSTLLAALLPLIQRRGIPTVLYQLHDRQRHLPGDPGQEELTAGTVVIVDVYEQLGLWSRIRLRGLCRRKRLGLLVTTHRPVALPLLYQTRSSPELAHEIASMLLAEEGQASQTISRDEVSRLFEKHRGNLREVLFGLYDWYELRQQQHPR